MFFACLLMCRMVVGCLAERVLSHRAPNERMTLFVRWSARWFRSPSKSSDVRLSPNQTQTVNRHQQNTVINFDKWPGNCFYHVVFFYRSVWLFVNRLRKLNHSPSGDLLRSGFASIRRVRREWMSWLVTASKMDSVSDRDDSLKGWTTQPDHMISDREDAITQQF